MHMNNYTRFASLFFVVLFLCIPLSAQDTVETIVRENVETAVATMNIRTNVSGVEVYVNAVYKGVAPLTIENMVPGMYSIHLEKDGWEPKSVFVQLQAHTETNLYFELIPKTGFLRIYTDLADAEISIDGERLESTNSYDTGLIELQEGNHIVEIKKFGYRTKTETVTIFERFFSELYFEMEKSLFVINAFSANAPRFNPLSPGNLGLVSFHFTLSAPGSAVFEVYDKNGLAIFTQTFYNLNSPNHSVTWNGKNSLGIALPEGEYTARLEALPAEGWEIIPQINNIGESLDSVFAMTSTIIDNSIFYPIVSSGSSGTSVGVANARLMPTGTTLISFNAATDFSVSSGLEAVPFSFNATFTPFSLTEISLRIGAEAESTLGDSMPVFFGGALKISAPIQNAYMGGIVRYTYSTEPTYASVYSEPGLGFGFIGGIELGNLLFSLSEEAVFGSATGLVNEFDGHLKTALGVQFQKGIFSSSVWASLYSPFTFNGMQFFETFESGVEASVLIPNTTIIPTLGCSYIYSNNYAHNIMLRLGINFLIL